MGKSAGESYEKIALSGWFKDCTALFVDQIYLNFVADILATWVSAKTITPMTGVLCKKVKALLWKPHAMT